MIVYIIELVCIVFNTLGGFKQLKLNNKVIAIINFVLAGILIILTAILAIQDINAYFYNKKIEKKYKEQINDSKDL